MVAPFLADINSHTVKSTFFHKSSKYQIDGNDHASIEPLGISVFASQK